MRLETLRYDRETRIFIEMTYTVLQRAGKLLSVPAQYRFQNGEIMLSVLSATGRLGVSLLNGHKTSRNFCLVVVLALYPVIGVSLGLRLFGVVTFSWFSLFIPLAAAVFFQLQLIRAALCMKVVRTLLDTLEEVEKAYLEGESWSTH